MKGKRAYNFNAGPAALPLEVLQEAAEQLTNYEGTGMSVMEMSHRSAAYERLHNEAQERIRRLLKVPDGYKVLFLQGGATTQFAMVPMNLLSEGSTAAYAVHGSWGAKALKEAKLFGNAVEWASTKADGYRRVPELSAASLPENTAYVHITSNETIEGVQYAEFPDLGDAVLVADMSSDIMSRPFDVSKFGLIYAGAQKNLGPSGVTVVIAREDLVAESPAHLPTMLRYDTHVKSNSLHNTPPTFAIYMVNLVLGWIESQGGLAGMEKRNRDKTEPIYRVIDESDGFYVGHADPAHRSRMNITFRLAREEDEKAFLAAAAEAGFVGLKGHRSVGGCRASTYNAVPPEACAALAEFMDEFRRGRC